MSDHRAYQMYAHITWHTWRRVGCLDRLAAVDVKSAVASACGETGVRVLQGAVLSDHVHLVVSFQPDVRISDFVRLAKSRAATRANRRVVGTVRWARGYYVTTLHRNDLARVKRYVARQFERHPDRIPRDRRREIP
jgi:putative transposase